MCVPVFICVCLLVHVLATVTMKVFVTASHLLQSHSWRYFSVSITPWKSSLRERRAGSDCQEEVRLSLNLTILGRGWGGEAYGVRQKGIKVNFDPLETEQNMQQASVQGLHREDTVLCFTRDCLGDGLSAHSLLIVTNLQEAVLTLLTGFVYATRDAWSEIVGLRWPGKWQHRNN